MQKNRKETHGMKAKLIVIFSILLMFSKPQSGESHFSLGMTYSHGLIEVFNLYKDNLKTEGHKIKNNAICPAGFFAGTYYQFGSGFAAGCVIGPFMTVISKNANFIALPLTGFIKYSFFIENSVCPYISLGVNYAPAAGKYVNRSIPGLYAAAGAEFMRNESVGFGFEFAYTKSAIEFDCAENGKNKKLRPSVFLISAFAVF